MRKMLVRIIAIILATLVLFTLFPSSALALTHTELHDNGVMSTRIAGADRIETANTISYQGFHSANNVVIASGNNYPDALAGVSLAYALDAPILLVRDGLTAETMSEIKRLGASSAYILGGSDVIPDIVTSQLSNLGVKSTRISGNDRFKTANAIAKQLVDINGTPNEIFIAYAYNYPDALAAGNVAAMLGSPIFYADSDGSLDKETEQLIATAKADKVTILGGYNVISEKAERNIEILTSAKVARLCGENRYETCAAINNAYADLFSSDSICIATGDNYPDALAGGAFAAVKKSPMVLIGNRVTQGQKDFIIEYEPRTCYIFGGDEVISSHMVEAVTFLSGYKATLPEPVIPKPVYLTSESRAFEYDSGVTDEEIEAALYYMNQNCPREVWEHFVDNGWTLRMCSDMDALEKKYNIGFGISGLCAVGEKLIYVDSSTHSFEGAVLHEFGHYAYYGMMSESERRAADSYYDKYMKLIDPENPARLRRHHISNASEFFAQTYELIVLGKSLTGFEPEHIEYMFGLDIYGELDVTQRK